MKKKIFYYIVCSFLINSIQAQGPIDARIYPTDMNKYTILDSANYKFYYTFTHLADTTKPKTRATNNLILLVGNNVSRFFSSDYFKKMKDDNKKKTMDSPVLGMRGDGLNATEIFKNYRDKKELVTTRVPGTHDIFTYEENFPEFEWQLTNETDTILSYPCTKAVTNFRGRTYTVWFSMDIPISDGPWKFGKLPGLILKVSDSQNYFTFDCVKIEALKNKEPIVRYEGKYVPSSRESVNKLIRNVHEKPIMTYEAMGLTYIGDKSKPKPPKPYNPLELE